MQHTKTMGRSLLAEPSSYRPLQRPGPSQSSLKVPWNTPGFHARLLNLLASGVLPHLTPPSPLMSPKKGPSRMNGRPRSTYIVKLLYKFTLKYFTSIFYPSPNHLILLTFNNVILLIFNNFSLFFLFLCASPPRHPRRGRKGVLAFNYFFNSLLSFTFLFFNPSFLPDVVFFFLRFHLNLLS